LCSVIFCIGVELIKPMEISPWRLLVSTCYVLSRLGLMIFYVTTLVRLAQHPAWLTRLQPLAVAGRRWPPLAACHRRTT
jgi:hypothetical protein